MSKADPDISLPSTTHPTTPASTTTIRMQHSSALPVFYWFVFGWYEPLLATGGALGALLYPEQVYIQQAPWPQDELPQGPLPRAAVVTLLQLAHTVGLLGLLNFFVLWAARKYLWSQPAIQEKIVGALLTPLLLGDFLHIFLTLWAIGDDRWEVQKWQGTLWITIVSGFTLMIPRLAWHLGVGRYMDNRDGRPVKKI
ncbi:uncharacterized protein PHACADRAFT_249493 [Phanerochaete carnosa HHB-10118-sp]|uniref:DUF7704 domain-containing protein n=1 Tax=Phanerochaete carnosa (strain HHB-10118-sp) TaxID=650164 RepID=K5WIJ4_PHACS|nr:uncharacterized protein PHACADRAFT_249493 [Phanerochaete carnosa HHB-10118-sp]EKM59205.1 hypothetical protein PHACADRAFT_249493 [Phanerochaete carnosa HHB-10118-sp]